MRSRSGSLLGAMGRFVPFLWPKDSLGLRARVVAAVALLVGAKLINVQIPFFFKDIVDSLTVEPGDAAAAVALPVAALLAYGLARLGTALFTELRDALFARVAQRAGRRLSLVVYERLFAFSLRYHLDRQTGQLARILDRGIDAVMSMLWLLLFNVVPTLLELALVIGILLARYDPAFALATLLTIVGYGAFTLVATGWRTRLRRAMNDADNALRAMTVDGLLNYETVKTFTNERYESRRYDRALALYEDAAVRSRTSLSVLNLGQAAIIAVGVTAVMLLAARGVVAGTMTVGDVVLVNTFLLQLYQPLNMLGMVYREIRQGLTDMEQLDALLGRRPEIVDAPDAKPLRLSGAEVRFEEVGFGYDPRRPVIEQLSFTVPAGHTVAVVGSSGAGKSTLVRLLFRFYDVDSGAIRIDGQDIRGVTQGSLRRAIGIVPQDTVLFNDTIGANIAYGRPDASPAEIEAAARLAQIHDFIAAQPDGYDTLVGERGLKLSGGEKQRVAIARMALKDPPILVFDEATSALDSVTEASIRDALRRIARGRTTLVIAHRLSTVVDADEILVLEGGRLIERGRHAELLARDGVYADLWRRQAEAAASATSEVRAAE